MQTSVITVLSRHMDSVYSVTILVLPAVGIVGLVLWILINYQTKKKCTAVTKGMCTNIIEPVFVRDDPVMWYSYEVDGKKYTVCANMNKYRSKNIGVIKALLYKPVVVRYDPQKPKRSYPDIELTLSGNMDKIIETENEIFPEKN